MNKDKENEIKNMLKLWGNSSGWLAERKNEYDKAAELCKKAEVDCIVPKDLIFSCRAEAENAFNRLREKLFEKSRIDEAVSQLDALEREIIICRYAKKIKWQYIPAHMPVIICERQCMRIHKDALEKLAKMLGLL